MATFVALLRGVNVGDAKTVPMAEQRKLLTGLGYSDVATFLNSGNAVFRAASSPARLTATIAGEIAAKMDVEVPVVVKSAGELSAIVSENPISAPEADQARLLVAFARDAAALSTLRPIGSLVVPPERFALGAHAAYFYCPFGSLKSEAGKTLLGRAGRAATTRNWKTVLKLQKLADSIGGPR
jgi:uncharacterized protein (DUF1697 family)